MIHEGQKSLFMKALHFTSEWEGGYVNDAVDRGGETKFGISKRSYPHIDIPNLTREEADQIYYDDYWLRPRFDLLTPRLAVAAFDFGVNSGRRRAVRYLQKLVDANQDGYIGPNTVMAIALTMGQFIDGDLELADLYTGERMQFLMRIIERDPSQARFRNGWTNRVNALRKLLMEEWEK